VFSLRFDPRLYNEDLVCMSWIAKSVMFSEGCSAVSNQLRHGMSAGTSKSIKIRFGASSFLIDLDNLRVASHSKDEHPLRESCEIPRC
jgi:hypothetical protein